jgi:hypothetical protein
LESQPENVIGLINSQVTERINHNPELAREVLVVIRKNPGRELQKTELEGSDNLFGDQEQLISTYDFFSQVVADIERFSQVQISDEDVDRAYDDTEYVRWLNAHSQSNGLRDRTLTSQERTISIRANLLRFLADKAIVNRVAVVPPTDDEQLELAN